MTDSIRPLLPIAALALLLSGCATTIRPVLYPNAALERVGQDVAQADIDACIENARAYGAAGNKAGEVAAGTARDAAMGAAIGAAGGAVLGRAGRGAAIGAATGGTRGLLRGVFSSGKPDPVLRRFVEQCLAEKGYRTIGWR